MKQTQWQIIHLLQRLRRLIWQCDHFRVDTVSLPPSSDIPDGVVKGKGSWRGESHFTAAIRNVLTFLSAVQAFGYHATDLALSEPLSRNCSLSGFFFRRVSGGALLWNVMNTEGLVDACLFLLEVTGKGWKIYLGLSRKPFFSLSFFLFIRGTCSDAGLCFLKQVWPSTHWPLLQ